VVRRMRRAHPDGRLLQRRAEPLPALQADGPRAAAQPQPRQPAPPAWRSCAAGEHWRPGGPAQSPPSAPQRCARCHLRPGPGPGLCTPVMTIPDGERTLPQYAPQGRCRTPTMNSYKFNSYPSMRAHRMSVRCPCRWPKASEGPGRHGWSSPMARPPLIRATAFGVASSPRSSGWA
jgi:hypothetical protein